MTSTTSKKTNFCITKNIVIKEPESKEITKKKPIRRIECWEKPTFRNYLDDNYFLEYKKCIRGNSYISDRYKRLAAIDVNKYDINRLKKKLFKKRNIDVVIPNHLEDKYFNLSLSSISMNGENIKKASIDDITTSNRNSKRILPSIDELNKDINNSNINVNRKRNKNRNGNKNKNNNSNENQLLSSNIENIQHKKLKRNSYVANKLTKKPTSLNGKSIDKVNISSSIDDEAPLPKNLKEEYFSTELLLLPDTDDIFHINEDLFTTEQYNDKLILEKCNFNISNSKYLENFKRQQQDQIKKKTPVLSSSNTKNILNNGNNEEKQDDNKITIYNSCRRKNIKKIANMMNATRNMTPRKSVYTNFDYSDDEYGLTNSSSSSDSDSSYTSYCEQKEKTPLKRRHHHHHHHRRKLSDTRKTDKADKKEENVKGNKGNKRYKNINSSYNK